MCCLFDVSAAAAGKVLKVVVIVFLVLQVLLGIGAVSVGAVALSALAPSYEADDSSSLAAHLSLFAYALEVKSFAKSRIAQACGLVIAIGCALILSGLFGLGAIANHNPQWLLVLLAALVVAAAVSTGGTVISAKWRSEAAQSIFEVMKWTIQTQYDGNLNSTNKWSRLWDLAQATLNCCGITNGSDYSTAHAFQSVYVGPELGLDASLYLSANASGNSSGGVGGGGAFVKLRYPITCCKLNLNIPAQVEQVLQGSGKFFGFAGKQLLQDQHCLINPSTANSYIDVGCRAKVVALKDKYTGLLEGLAGATVGFQYILMLLIIAVIYAAVS